MTGLAEVVRQHGQHYIASLGARLLPSHVRALRAIASCRTAALGGHIAHCSRCDTEHLLYHSCRHRACPQCGHDATQRWLSRQRELMLPVPYFHVVFTLPAELRRVVRAHQKTLLPVLFRAAFDSLAALVADPKFVGEQIGALAVSHTWTRTLEWHPHLHVLVPGGALAADGRTWLTIKARNKRFLVPVKALAARFRGRFLHLARRCVPAREFPHVPWSKPCVVFAKPAVQGADAVLAYLGRYVHRTAIADKAIAACHDGRVTFTYRDTRDQTRKRMTLPAHEFLRRFLQHVPAKGLHRVRAYGLLRPAHRDTLRRLQLLLAAESEPSPERKAVRRARRCPRCHQEGLVLLRRLAPDECGAWSARHLLVSAHPRAPPTVRPADGGFNTNPTVR
jgi:hypothetical protein